MSAASQVLPISSTSFATAISAKAEVTSDRYEPRAVPHLAPDWRQQPEAPAEEYRQALIDHELSAHYATASRAKAS